MIDSGFECEHRAWLKEEQDPGFFPTGRLLCIKNNEGRMIKCGRCGE